MSAERAAEGAQSWNDVPTDPAFLSAAVIRVVRTDRERRTGRKVHRHHMEIDGWRDGHEFTVPIARLDVEFPARSPKGAAEAARTQSGKAPK